VTTVVLDTHVLHWWSADRGRMSQRAAQVVAAAGELVVADISWYELVWLERRGRIVTNVPVANWLERLSRFVRTAPVTPRIAATAAQLPDGFPTDPADRLIFATALENGWALVSKDDAFRRAGVHEVEVVW
jgi:PIN domain nuclease of toxin-antitoxin system